ncbi:MAG: hypothetical protein ACLT0Y_08000 [Christensenellales bacterium]
MAGKDQINNNRRRRRKRIQKAQRHKYSTRNRFRNKLISAEFEATKHRGVDREAGSIEETARAGRKVKAAEDACENEGRWA